MGILQMLGLGGNAPVKELCVIEANEKAENEGLLLIDVRQPQEWQQTGRPQNSLGVTLQDPTFMKQVMDVLDNDLARNVAFTCRSGARSAHAAMVLQNAGFTNVYNVKGGIIAWIGEDLPLDKVPF